MAVRVPPVMRRLRSATLGRPRLPARLSARRGRILALLGLLGPGLIAANAGNDAGGVATYASAGAKYGYGLLWTIVLITISLAVVQMLAARMGVVTGKGLAELVREEYGIRWSVLATTAILIATTGTTITPYMQLYLQSAVVERGVREENLRHEEREAVSGAVFANLVAAFIIIATGATLFTHGVHEISSAADAARALNPFAGRYAEVLFGVGLLGASL